MKLYDITTEVYNTYKNTVKGNKNISYDMCRRKLTRNILLSKIIGNKHGKILYRYGQLEILVRNRLVVWIHNVNSGRHIGFYKDMDKYNKLNKILGITNNGKEMGKFKKLLINMRLAFVYM